jgi:hypothetical protein
VSEAARATTVFRVGDWAEVRPIEEIFATLDERGRLEGLPFMPEMAQHCGRRFRVLKSAHKTCDPTGKTNLRRMPGAVHLETRCDGSAHDGCESRCLLFWKTAWLKPVQGSGDSPAGLGAASADLTVLHAATRNVFAGAAETRFVCQATEIVRATTDLPSRNLRQYVDDIATRNVSLPAFVRHFGTAVVTSIASKLGKLAGVKSRPAAALPTSQAPPQALNFQPGELVQIRSAEEIRRTLDDTGKNRGLSFEDEMQRYCGGVYRVAYRVGQIIDETSGKKIKLGKDCIVLEGLACAGLANRGRLFCPRASYYYWREIWLKRVGKGDAAL